MVWDFSQSVRKVTQTAIATVNNDLFRDFIVPRHSLSEKFDGIVNSCEAGEYRKDRLCLYAADIFGLNPDKHRILLIDDKPRNIEDFIALGGEGFLYESDETFALWLSGKL